MVRIEKAETGDAAAIAQLVTELRTDMNGRAVCTAEEMLGPVTDAMKEPSYQAFVARDKGEAIVGFVGVNDRFAVYAMGKFFQITELYVKPSSRAKGFGKALLSAVEDLARSKGVCMIELGAPGLETHPATHRFYQHNGYHLAGPRLKKSLV